MKKILISALLLMLILTACENGNITEESNIPNEYRIEDFYPLTENAKYIYEGVGNEYTSYTVFIDYKTDSRVQIRTNNGGSESVKVLELKDGQLKEVFFRGETYFRENFADDEYTESKILLKEPLKEGNSWLTGENSETVITNISKKVVTTQGNLDAIEVTTKNNNETVIEYYARNKGLVKTVNKGEGYETVSTLSDIENNVPFIQTVTLFYPDINGINLNTIDVPVSFNTNDEPKDVIEKTLKDLSVYEIFSPNTKINELYYSLEENSAHIDLSKEFITEMNLGAGFEEKVLTCIANTLGTYYDTHIVYLTIEGGPYESGHIILEEGEPLSVDYSNTKIHE
ncbi:MULTISPECIES: GerMN domain-containing protein [unclassified Sedimentibacter]|uniref:GerMN domain-containing protein n=1 Tax=unclassified Sedimentibacter TaxID=2649220 RepID=UPI0027E1DBC3|nr:GerMN domain-containing protein [Sedimentibacter sp. MB35-C1]WMJ78350.1 GerMN domain-containing protein [Sedimentibacter sp. MB35-C1]